MPAKREISLLPEESNPNSISNRIMTWLSTVGRFVIVFVELIVILAFLSRFILDRKNSDLSETLRQQRAILESTKDFETEYNLLQQRLSYISDFYKDDPDYLAKVQTVVKSTPPEIIYDRFSINRDPETSIITTSLTALAYQESSIVDFITNLILNPEIASVDIQTIEKKTRDNKYSLRLEISYKLAPNNALSSK